MRNVEWTIPISLGDSHRGYRVMGTNQDYFRYFSYGQKLKLRMAQGRSFSDTYEAVLGSQVARELDYQLGREIIIAHGLGEISFSLHDNKPFTISGILEPTGTPVDRTVHISLQGMEAIHKDWQPAPQISAQAASPGSADTGDDLVPSSITAFLVGLKSRIMTFQLQRQINEFRDEPLMAILPGVALAELWQILSMVENMLLFISAMVILACLTGMLTTLLAGLNERRREMAILRANGARPVFIFLLVFVEALIITLTACCLGVGLLWICLYLLQPMLTAGFGIHITNLSWSIELVAVLGLVILVAAVFAVIPAATARRRTLHDGLTVRL